MGVVVFGGEGEGGERGGSGHAGARVCVSLLLGTVAAAEHFRLPPGGRRSGLLFGVFFRTIQRLLLTELDRFRRAGGWPGSIASSGL